jgi:hypothetical protein
MVEVPGAVYAPDVVCARFAPVVPPLPVEPMPDAPVLDDEPMPDEDEPMPPDEPMPLHALSAATQMAESISFFISISFASLSGTAVFFSLPICLQLLQWIDEQLKTEVPAPAALVGGTLDSNQQGKIPWHERHYCVDR